MTTNEEVAIKLECLKTRHPQLHTEAKLYKIMQTNGKFMNYFYFQKLLNFHNDYTGSHWFFSKKDFTIF